MKRICRNSLMLTGLAMLSSLAACQTTKTGATDRAAVCSIFPAITYSSRDTDETVIQIRRHNAGFKSYCGN